MGAVVRWPRHKLHGGWQHSAPTECFMCTGGLAWCVVCSGAEAALPTHCPGAPMSEQQMQAVAALQTDYVNGAWLPLPPRRRLC